MRQAVLKVHDYIVVGSGPGGSVTADELSRAGFSILLIEEATNGEKQYIPHSMDEVSNLYRYGGLSAAFGKRPIALIEGKAVGGSSQINSGIYHRLPIEIYNLWLKKVPSLDFRSLEKIFEEIEKNLHINSNYKSTFTDLLINGSTKLGWSYSMRPRWIETNNNDPMEIRRFAMKETYLNKAKQNKISILYGRKVLKIKYENKIWKITTVNSKNEQKIFNCKKVVLCAGAIQTPIILRNSGFKHYIGNSIRIHPMVRFIYKFDNIDHYPNSEVPPFQITQWLPKTTIGCSASELSNIALWLNKHSFNFLKTEKTFQYRVGYSLISTNTTGRLFKIGNNSYRILYNLTKNDNKLLIDGSMKLNELMSASGASHRIINYENRTFPKISVKDPNWNMESLVAKELKLSNLSTIHIYGSCPMGNSSANSACNEFGKIWDTENLYINDSSILPDMLGVNPQGTIMALAIRNARKMIEAN